MQGKMWVNM